MHIAIDCRLWSQGGVGRYIRNLVWELAVKDSTNNYTLFCMGEDKHKIAQLIAKNNSFKIIKTSARWHSFAEQITFGRELLSGNFDLVHFPYFSHPVFYNRPFVVTIHDLTILHHHTGKATTHNVFYYALKRMGYGFALSHAVNASRQIITPTEFVKKDIMKTFKTAGNKIHVTYEGVGRDFIEAKPAKMELPFNEFFLYVGNCYPHKNVEMLINAWKELPEANLVVVAPNDYFTRRIFLHAREAGLLNRVRFIHNVSDGELKYLYRKAMALILPSLFEGFGLPVVEAAYSQCPLLLSDIPAFTEIAPRYARFFSAKKPDECLAKIKETIKKPRKAIAELGYFKRFSFYQLATETRKVYNSFT